MTELSSPPSADTSHPVLMLRPYQHPADLPFVQKIFVEDTAEELPERVRLILQDPPILVVWALLSYLISGFLTFGNWLVNMIATAIVLRAVARMAVARWFESDLRARIETALGDDLLNPATYYRVENNADDRRGRRRVRREGVFSNFWSAVCVNPASGENVVVAFVGLKHEKGSKVGIVKRLYVDRAFHRLGIATKLLGHLVLWCADFGVSSIEIRVSTLQVNGMKMVEKFDFTRIGKEKISQVHGEVIYNLNVEKWVENNRATLIEGMIKGNPEEISRSR